MKYAVIHGTAVIFDTDSFSDAQQVADDASAKWPDDVVRLVEERPRTVRGIGSRRPPKDDAE